MPVSRREFMARTGVAVAVAASFYIIPHPSGMHPTSIGHPFLPEPRSEVDPLSLSEIESIPQTCPALWHPYFTTAFKTGARPSEMAALKWGDVD